MVWLGNTLLRHNVLISQDLDATGTFLVNLSCPFTPDEVKVRQTGFFVSGGAPAPGVYTIHVPGLGSGSAPGSCLGAVMDPSTVFSAIVIPLPTFGNGTYRVEIRSSGALATTLNGGQLVILLEFRKNP